MGGDKHDAPAKPAEISLSEIMQLLQILPQVLSVVEKILQILEQQNPPTPVPTKQ